MVPLPVGRTIEAVQPSATIANLEDMRRTFAEQIWHTFGIPPAFISAPSVKKPSAGGMAAGTSTGATGTGRGAPPTSNDTMKMRMTIRSVRQDAMLLIQYVYDVLFWRADAEAIARILCAIDIGTLDAATQSADDEDWIERETRGRFRNMRAGTRKPSSRKKEGTLRPEELLAFQHRRRRQTRIEVIFPKDPLPEQVDFQTVIAASDRGMLSPIEEINLGRECLKLTPIDAKNPLVTEKMAARERAQATEDATLLKEQNDAKAADPRFSKAPAGR